MLCRDDAELSFARLNVIGASRFYLLFSHTCFLLLFLCFKAKETLLRLLGLLQFLLFAID